MALRWAHDGFIKSYKDVLAIKDGVDLKQGVFDSVAFEILVQLNIDWFSY